MKIATPKDWEQMELTEAVTACGHKVMIPKDYLEAWKAEQMALEHAKKHNRTQELLDGIKTCDRPKVAQMLKVFYEVYQN